MRTVLALVAAFALVLAALPAAASTPKGEACNGSSVEFGCYNQASHDKCGSKMGSSCAYQHGDYDGCSADGGFGCNDVCAVKDWCNQTFPDCCQGNCAAYFKFTKSGTQIFNSCPRNWKP